MRDTYKILIKAGIIFLIMVIIVLVSHFVGLKNEIAKRENTDFGEYYCMKVKQFRHDNASIEPGSVDVAFIGDSLTDLCDLDKYYQPYNTINRGISGDTTDGVLNRLDSSAYALNPKVIVLLIGINNLGEMFNTYEAILSELTKHLPNTKIIVLSLAPLGTGLKQMNATVEFQNKRLKTLVEKYQLRYVDIYSALLNETTHAMYDKYTTDMLHFSDQGYQVISSVVRPVIKELLG